MNAAAENHIKFDPLADEHEELKRAVADLRIVLAARRESPKNVAELIQNLAESLRAHFVHEELEDGFFDSVIDQAPWLQPQAVSLIDEHRDLAAQLSRFHWQATQGNASAEWWQELSCQFEAFWKVLLRHEQRENDLVQKAFLDDVGAED